MTANALHDSSRVAFALLPERGPMALHLRGSKPPHVNAALREIKSQVKALREGRAKVPVLVSVDADHIEAMAQPDPMDLMVKALSRAGFTCVGFLAGSLSAQALADAANLMVMPAPGGCDFAALADFAQRVDAQALAEQEARDWDEALEIDALFNAAQIERDWDEALVMDQEFNARREAERIALARQRAEEEARDWDLAIAEDEAFEARLFAQAWDEAHAYNELLAQAEQAAAAARKAVLEGFNPPVLPKAPAIAARPSPRMEAVRTPSNPAASVPSPSPARAVPTAVEGDRMDVDVALAEPPTPTAAARIHNDRVRSGQVLHAKGGDLNVFGIVSSGAEIVADGNVNAYAPVYGRIVAGAQGNKATHVICQQFYAELVSIGGSFVTSDDLPRDLQGEAVHFWFENDSIHFRRLSNLGKPVPA